MTPYEAEQKACCGPVPEATGMPIGSRNYHTCSASACMAWRWKEDKRTEAFSRALVEHMKATNDGYNKAVQEVLKRRDEFVYSEGFCGLAGGVGHAP